MMLISFLKQSTIKWPFWKWIFGGVGSIVAILSIGKNFFELSVSTSLLFGVDIIVIIWILRSLYLIVVALMSYVHNMYVDSIWGVAIIELKNAYSEIHFLRKKRRNFGY